MSEEPNMDEIAGGMALWQEHRPQTGEDWMAVAERCLEQPPKPENPSPLFAGLLLAVERAIAAEAASAGSPSSEPGGLSDDEVDEAVRHDAERAWAEARPDQADIPTTEPGAQPSNPSALGSLAADPSERAHGLDPGLSALSEQAMEKAVEAAARERWEQAKVEQRVAQSTPWNGHYLTASRAILEAVLPVLLGSGELVTKEWADSPENPTFDAGWDAGYRRAKQHCKAAERALADCKEALTAAQDAMERMERHHRWHHEREGTEVVDDEEVMAALVLIAQADDAAEEVLARLGSEAGE